MRTITTTTGVSITLDGDVLAILEALYLEITVKKDFDRSFEDMMNEINHLIGQMTDEERRACLLESLFLNAVKYENDRAEAYMRKLSAKKASHRPSNL
jgi:hypothetical protein